MFVPNYNISSKLVFSSNIISTVLILSFFDSILNLSLDQCISFPSFVHLYDGLSLYFTLFLIVIINVIVYKVVDKFIVMLSIATKEATTASNMVTIAGSGNDIDQ